MSDRATFLAAMDAAAPNVATPDKDPVDFYLTQLREASTASNKTYYNARFGRAKIEDVRPWLIQVAACTLKAWLATFEPRQLVNERDLVSTEGARLLMERLTGFSYSRQVISALVLHTKELKVVAVQKNGRGGRPMNYFHKKDVIAAANRRLNNEGMCSFTGCKLKAAHRGQHKRALP